MTIALPRSRWLLLLVLTAGTAAAQTVIQGVSFPEADADGNGYINRDEARAVGLRDVFEDLDTDADSRLEVSEFEAVARGPDLLVIPQDPADIPELGNDTGPATAGGITQ